ncbi:glucose kinase, partial [Xanthomonas oryzae pv. oryzae]
MAAISRSADVSASPAVPVATSFIAADVGGAHVRLDHMVQASDAAIALSHYRSYRCAEHASLEAILGDFLQQQRAVDAVVIANAGVALDDGSFLSATPCRGRSRQAASAPRSRCATCTWST